LGNVGSVAGLLGNAASFPVTGGLTKLWNQTGTPVTSGNFSASLWINATSAAGSPGLLVQAHQTVTDTFVGKQELLIFSSKFTFSMDNATITQDTAAVTLNAWNHVVGVYDGTKQYLFVNGTLKASAAVTPDYTQLDAVYLGSSLVSALIDEAGIWNRALSFGGVSVGQVATGEVAALYNNGAGVTWPFTGI